MKMNRNKIYTAFVVVLVFGLVLGAVSLGFFLAAAPEKIEKDEGEQIPTAVTIVGVDKVNIISTGLFSADSVASFPFVEMKTFNGGTIIGIIDVVSLEEGDKIFIIEDWKCGRSNVLRGYSWYKFAGYQQEDEINNSRNLSS